jgi:hypothetical protein
MLEVGVPGPMPAAVVSRSFAVLLTQEWRHWQFNI